MAVQTISTTGDIPEVLDPFYTGRPGAGTVGQPGYKAPITGLLDRGISAIYPDGLAGAAAYAQQFAPLIEQGLIGAGTVAPMSQFQQALGTRLAGMTVPDQFALAEQTGQAGASGLQALLGVQAPTVSADLLSTFSMDPARQFSSAETTAYMSPYMQGVVDVQQRKAIEDAQRAQLGQNLAAGRQGTYGGARQALLQGQRESGLRTQLGDIQAQGLQRAYEQAQQQFERDRAAQMGVGQQNLAAKLGVQQLSSGQSLEAQRANQQAALQAGQTRLGAAQGLGGLAQTFGGLGTQQLAGELDVLKTQGAFGDLQRSISQQQMDAQRQALQDQAQYGQTQVGQLSNLLRGIPLSDTTQQNMTPPPSFASQLTGLGLTGIGLYNLLGGGK
jgi:hypothetical protein